MNQPECIEYDGWATAQRVDDERVEWVQRDAKIHVSKHLLADPDARAFIEQSYRIGEPCLLSGDFHADRIEAP
jgi:hypothetical protein